MVKNSNHGFKHEAFGKVAYVVGLLDGKLDFDNWDEIAIACENIAIDWSNMVDIRDFEEEGFIMKYAERKLLEKYAKESE